MAWAMRMVVRLFLLLPLGVQVRCVDGSASTVFPGLQSGSLRGFCLSCDGTGDICAGFCR